MTVGEPGHRARRRNEMDQLEREEEALTQQYENGEISTKEYNDAIRELYRDARAFAEERAREAYERELERW